jgi:GT2 family glycosyltransferase
MSVSLVVITREISFRLEACLAAVSAHDPAADEIVLLLDAPRMSAAPNFTYGGRAPRPRLFWGREQGRAAARNDGARAATGTDLIFLDGDMLTPPDFISRHRAALAQGGYVRGRVRELIGAAVCADLAVGGIGFPPLSLEQLAANGFSPDAYRTTANTLEQAIEARFLHGEGRIPQWLASAGANFSLGRKLWTELAGQDERFGSKWGCEDLEFAYRTSRSGAKITFAADAIAYHLSHPQPARWEEHGRTLEIFREIHSDPDIANLHHLLSNDGDLNRYRAALAARVNSVDAK